MSRLQVACKPKEVEGDGLARARTPPNVVPRHEVEHRRRKQQCKDELQQFGGGQPPANEELTTDHKHRDAAHAHLPWTNLMVTVRDACLSFLATACFSSTRAMIMYTSSTT